MSLSYLISSVPELPVVFFQGRWILAFYGAQLLVCAILLWFERERNGRGGSGPKHYHDQPVPLAA